MAGPNPPALLLDTNTVVSALLWNGPPAQLLEQAVDQELTLYTSEVLLAELRATLGYEA
jgi:predicted nucleic acid-binding protein